MEPQILRGITINDTVFVMGDPGRVDLLSGLLDDYRVVFDMRGYRVVNGSYKGVGVTLASHGIGCPMASIIFEELKMLGAETIIRIGTAGSLDEEIDVGDVLLAESAGSYHGLCSTKMYFGDITPPTSPDPILLVKTYNILRSNGLNPILSPVFSSDSFYAEEKHLERIRLAGYRAIDMETLILYALGKIRNYRALSILVISNNLAKRTPLKQTPELRGVFRKIFKILLDNIDTIKH